MERSENGLDFYEIGTVDGNGTTNEVNNYSFRDEAPISTVEYYRLKQIDFDGQFEYSDVKVGYTDQLAKQIDMTVYPNPAVERLQIKSNRPMQFKQLVLINISGKVVADLTKDLAGGGLKLETRVPKLEKGLYYIKYSTLDGMNGSHKLIIE